MTQASILDLLQSSLDNNQAITPYIVPLSPADTKYFSNLIDSIAIFPSHIMYLGITKSIYQDNPFVTILNTQTWTKVKKTKWEAYIKQRFTTDDGSDSFITNFNNWCRSREVPLEGTPLKKISFYDNPDFNLLFNNEHNKLVCYIKPNTDNKQLIHLVIKDNTNNGKFWTTIMDYLRYTLHLKSLQNYTADAKVAHALQHELTTGLHFIKEPIKLISNSPDEYCFAYINLNPKIYNKTTEAWDSFLDQFNARDRKLFMAWIYSIFVAHDKNRQILWIEGEGNTGKSTITSVIGNILEEYNPTLFISIPRDFKDTFALSGFETARLAILANCTNQRLIQIKEIQNITGNDHISIRKVQNDPINKRVFVKIMVTSNLPPIINYKLSHESSRLLHIRMIPHLVQSVKKNWKINKKSFEERLTEQFWAFMKQAKDAYRETIQIDGSLKVSNNVRSTNIQSQ